jgi:hypothetical protein
VENGDVIEVHDPLDTRRLQPYYVLIDCGAPGKLYCVTCHAWLANTFNLELHVQAGGAHRLVRWCQKHTTFERAKEQTIAACAKWTVPS